MPFIKDSREFGDLIEEPDINLRILAEGDFWLADPRLFLMFGKTPTSCTGSEIKST